MILALILEAAMRVVWGLIKNSEDWKWQILHQYFFTLWTKTGCVSNTLCFIWILLPTLCIKENLALVLKDTRSTNKDQHHKSSPTQQFHHKEKHEQQHRVYHRTKPDERNTWGDVCTPTASEKFGCFCSFFWQLLRSAWWLFLWQLVGNF